MTTQPYDAARLRDAVDEIRSLTREDPGVFVPQVCELCAGAGVALVFVPDVKGARVSGATRWFRPRRRWLQRVFVNRATTTSGSRSFMSSGP